MLMLDSAHQHSVMRMDLEYGKVVDEWKVSDVLEVKNILPEYAALNVHEDCADVKLQIRADEPSADFYWTLFVAIPTKGGLLLTQAHNGLFRIDPRVSGNKLVQSEFKQYANKNDFSAAATTETGKLAVASNKGDIRLFDQIGKNAKVSSIRPRV